MDSWKQYNDEQYSMLRLAVTDTSTGICLFRADNPALQLDVARRLKRDISKKSCVLNMAKVSSGLMPDSITKLRKLLDGYEDCKAVVICNLQLCGIELGEDEYIQRLNYMRDQLLALNKVWVLGMSNYFALLLSRHAIDLYSCIMNHFEFKSNEKVPFQELKMDDFTGNITIELYHFMILQNEIKRDGIENTSTDELFELIGVWNKIYEYCTEETAVFVKNVCKQVYDRIVSDNGIAAKECTRYCMLADAYSYLGDYKTSLEIISSIKEKYKEDMLKHNKQSYVVEYSYGNICIEAGEYALAADSFSRLLSYYIKMQSYFNYRTSNMLAWAYIYQGDYDKAIDIYIRMCILIDKDGMAAESDKAFLYNNEGVCFLAKRDYSNALKCFFETESLINKKNSIGVQIKAGVLKNIGYTYTRLGDYNKGLDYLMNAKSLLEQVDNIVNIIEKMRFIDNAIKECKDNIDENTDYIS